jgi:hypothetical protein
MKILESKVKTLLFIVFTITLGVLVMQCRHAPFPVPQAPIVSIPNDSLCYSDQISPIFVANCAQSGCHDHITRQSNVDMSSYSNVISTISGSFLLQVIQDPGSHQTSGYMPLSDVQIQALKDWVDQGMKDGVNCYSCDSSNVTFSGTINPIIQHDCISCHSTTGTLLATYSDVKITVDNGKFLCTVLQDTCQAMPQGSLKLIDCKINQIKKWIAAGAPNN